jgi:hypothetical protein
MHVALVIQHVKRMRRTTLSSVAFRSFLHDLKNRKIFGKKKISLA